MAQQCVSVNKVPAVVARGGFNSTPAGVLLEVKVTGDAACQALSRTAF